MLGEHFLTGTEFERAKLSRRAKVFLSRTTPVGTDIVYGMGSYIVTQWINLASGVVAGR